MDRHSKASSILSSKKTPEVGGKWFYFMTVMCENGSSISIQVIKQEQNNYIAKF